MWTSNVSSRAKYPIKNSFSYFGENLYDILEKDGANLPCLITSICENLYKMGVLKIEGIFRINGNSKSIENTKALINSSSSSNIPEIIDKLVSRDSDVHVAGSLLKLYLRELPEPLIYQEIAQDFIQTFSNGNTLSHLVDFERILLSLPMPNYAILQYLCRFLHQIHLHSGKTKMTAQALGIVFGPCIFKAFDDLIDSSHNGNEMKTFNHQNILNGITTVFIEHAPRLFRSLPKILNDSPLEPIPRYRIPQHPIPKPRYNLNGTDLSPNSKFGPSLNEETSRTQNVDHNWNISPYMNNASTINRNYFDSESPVLPTQKSLNHISSTQLFVEPYKSPIGGDAFPFFRNNETRMDIDSGDKILSTASSIIQKRISNTVRHYGLPRENRKFSPAVSSTTEFTSPVKDLEASNQPVYSQKVKSVARVQLYPQVQASISSLMTQSCKSPGQSENTMVTREPISSIRIPGMKTPNNSDKKGDTLLEQPQSSSRNTDNVVIPKLNKNDLFLNDSCDEKAMNDSGQESVEKTVLEQACSTIERSLHEKRLISQRPENLNDMTHKQLECEKLALQKALISFESHYGRPKTHDERSVMRPLYNRYRNVKRMLQQKSIDDFHSKSVSQDLPTKKGINMAEEWFGSNDPGAFERLGAMSISTHALQPGSQETLALFNTLESNRSLALYIESHQPNTSIYPQFNRKESTNGCRRDLNKSANTRRTTSHQFRKSSPNLTGSRKSCRDDYPSDFGDDSFDLEPQQAPMNFKNMSLAELRIQLEKVSGSKKMLQRRLKNFEHAIEAQTGSKITLAERADMKLEYENYRGLKKHLKELEVAVHSREQMLNS